MEIEKPLVVSAAIWALGQIDTLESARPIWETLEVAEDLRVIEAAQSALAIMSFDIETISLRAESDSALVRKSAIDQTANSSHPNSTKILLEALSDDDEQVQSAAIRGLSVSRIESLSQPVEQAFSSGTTKLKVNLIKALGMAQDNSSDWVTRQLISASQSKDPQVRVAAIESLAKQGNELSLEAVISASFDNNRSVKNAAVEALGRYNSDQARKRLEQILKEPERQSIQKSALRSIDLQKRLERVQSINK